MSIGKAVICFHEINSHVKQELQKKGCERDRDEVPRRAFGNYSENRDNYKLGPRDHKPVEKRTL